MRDVETVQREVRSSTLVMEIQQRLRLYSARLYLLFPQWEAADLRVGVHRSYAFLEEIDAGLHVNPLFQRL